MPKAKKCKVCRKLFTPVYSTTQQVCSAKCSVLFARKKQRREWESYARREKEKLKTKREWLKDLQKVFNAYIRKRDEGKPCISCGSLTGKRDAGHYRSVGSCPELRFNEMNVHAQCVSCNQHQHGNLIAYRKGLIERYGVAVVEALEGDHPPLKLTIPEIKEKIKYYKKLLK